MPIVNRVCFLHSCCGRRTDGRRGSHGRLVRHQHDDGGDRSDPVGDWRRPRVAARCPHCSPGAAVALQPQPRSQRLWRSRRFQPAGEELRRFRQRVIEAVGDDNEQHRLGDRRGVNRHVTHSHSHFTAPPKSDHAVLSTFTI